MAMAFPSSTVTVPSTPTASRARATSRPISASSLALCAATRSMASIPRTGRAFFFRSATTASTARSRPSLTRTGLAPAATTRSPSRAMNWASTQAVVVPSPAASWVLVATSRRSCAPRFSEGSCRVISRAMVAPSLVMTGGPGAWSMTTCRPRGPSVTRTAAATWSTPPSSAARARASNWTIFPMMRPPLAPVARRPAGRF